MYANEFPAGDRLIVVYSSDDTSDELDPLAIFESIAGDAAARAANGLVLLSLTAMPLRHAAVAFGREGSGYETKAAVAAVYGPSGSATAANLPAVEFDQGAPASTGPAPAAGWPAPTGPVDRGITMIKPPWA